MHVRRFAAFTAIGLVVLSPCIFLISKPLLLAQQQDTVAAASDTTLPPAVQAQLMKLQADFKTAEAAGDATAESKILDNIGVAYAGLSETQTPLEFYNEELSHLRASGDRAGEALALFLIGGLYSSLGEKQKELEFYSQALPLVQAVGDHWLESLTVENLGRYYSAVGEKEKALESYNRALTISRALGDRSVEALTLYNMGVANDDLGEKQKALEFYNQALPIFRTLSDRDGEAATLNDIGDVYWDLSENQNALAFYNQALTIFRALGNRDAEATTLRSIGQVYSELGEKRKALEFYEQALPIERAVGNRGGESATLSSIGHVYADLGEKQKALEYFNQALPIDRAVGDREGEATTLNNIGVVYRDLGEKEKALEYFDQALPILRAAGDRGVEATTLNNVGLVYSDLGEEQTALEYFDQALPIQRALGGHDGEATTLNNLGGVYLALGERQKALEFFNQALAILRDVGNRSIEATTLNNIGAVYLALGEKQKALEFFNEALPILRDVGNRSMEATTLNNIGMIYSDLGEGQKALEFFNQALPILRAVGDRSVEATTLNNVGLVYHDLGQKQKALEFFNQALPILRAVGNRSVEAATLNNLGQVYSDLGENQKALEYFNQTLPIVRAVGNRGVEAGTLNNMGTLYLALGERQQALEFLNQALPIAIAVNDPLLQATILNNLMVDQRSAQPSTAIFYGKQAVNLLQQVRGEITGLDKELQKSFLASKDDYYRSLADLLIAEGRLPEAQQVLNLLKEQEYSDFVRGDTANPLGALTLTPAEQQAAEDYQESTAQVVALGQEWADLRKVPARTAAQDARLKTVSDQLDAANAGLSGYYKRLYALLGAGSDANRRVADVKGDVSALKRALAKMPHTVALYTMVAKDGYRVILITASTQVAREYAIPEEEINKKVVALVTALEDYQSDAKVPAQELYQILIRPVEKDLEQAQADTLVWSLDSVLRYVPMGALYDGKQYMVEKYKTVTITPASIPRLGDSPDVSHLSAVAMGISQKYQSDLLELPSVAGELDHVVKDPRVKGADGVLPGSVLLNDAFTEKAMEEQLAGQHTVVHIASHFVFYPGDDRQSYLLMADGTKKDTPFHLTVADFNDNQNLMLTDTELLTLSACQTGLSSAASDGREVDGLGTAAQLKGAKAVISTLWEVADDSTGELMADFYGRWAKGGGKVEKVEALQQAQLDLLLGTARKGGSRFANSYYWAPFVLMGNWR